MLGTFLIVVLGNPLAAFLITRAFRRPLATALTMAASLAQIGEFSFILSGLGVGLHLLPDQAHDFILAGAILSIMVNPLLFALVERLRPVLEHRAAGPEAAVAAETAAPAELPVSRLTGHAVLVGFGRVGRLVGEALLASGRTILVIEDRAELASELATRGIEAIAGNAADAARRQGGQYRVRRAGSSSPSPMPSRPARSSSRRARANPTLEIVARAHSDAEVDYLKGYGADLIIMGEREIARAMIEHLLGEPLKGPGEAVVPPPP